MALGVDERQIGEHTYRVTQLTTLKARALFARLVQFLGPGVATAISSGNVSSILNMDIGALVGSLADKFTDNELAYFCTQLGSCSEIVVDGKTQTLTNAIIDVHFAGHLLDMFKWMAFALEVQFSDFLSEWKRIQAAALEAKAKSVQNSPAASTGTSGES